MERVSTADHARASGLKFLHGCFSITEWDYLVAQNEFQERLDAVTSTQDAEPLVRLGLRLLGAEHPLAIP